MLACGCDQLEQWVGLGEAPTTSESPSDHVSAPAPAELTVTEVAYAAGRKYAMSCVFAILGDDGKAESTYLQAQVAAARLDVSLPARAQKAEAMDRMVDVTPRATIEAKHGREVAFAFALGSKLSEASFAVGLGVSEPKLIDQIEMLAQRVPVPSSVWKAPLEGLRSAAAADAATGLSAAFDGYFRYEDKPAAPAWTGTSKPAPAREPFAHASAEGRYKATFPFEPRGNTERRDGVAWHKTSTEIDIYSVEWAEYPDTAAASAALDSFVNGLRGGGGEHREIEVAGRRAHMLTVPVGSTSMSIRTFVVDRRFYKVAAASKSDPEKADRFLDSFALAAKTG
jgi:hypothetical protein